jgi:hypothetical protein
VKSFEVHNGGTVISTFEEFPDGRYEGRLFYRHADGWRPPLPPDVRAPDGLRRSTSGGSAGSISRSSTLSTRPDWLLGETEDWRLRR